MRGKKNHKPAGPILGRSLIKRQVQKEQDHLPCKMKQQAFLHGHNKGKLIHSHGHRACGIQATECAKPADPQQVVRSRWWALPQGRTPENHQHWDCHLRHYLKLQELKNGNLYKNTYLRAAYSENNHKKNKCKKLLSSFN